MSDERAPDTPADQPAVGTGPVDDRRAFLRRLTGHAVNAAETLAGASSVVLRSAAAGGEAAAAQLGIGRTDDDVDSGSADREAAAHAVSPGPSPVAASPAPEPPPLRPLTDRETALLRASSAIVAANTLEGIPQLTRAPFHWDGRVARLTGQLFGARIGNVQRDGRISVMVEDSDGWLTLSGEAVVVAGPAALAEARPLLASLYPDEPAEDVWTRLETAALQAVIVLRPTRVISGAR